MIRIVIPIGGEGKRFADRGYSFPKPLVEIMGKPMIEIVAQNVAPSEQHEFIFIVREEHCQKFALADVLQLISPGCHIIQMKNRTAGALCSVLLAKDKLTSPSGELLIANADQYVDVPVDDFLFAARRSSVDGCITVFPSTHPKWSYAKVDSRGQVLAVAEKRPISRHATVGWYYFKQSADFISAAERMILKKTTVGGEYYICPVYNELVLAGKHISTFPIRQEQMHSLGTPEDVELFASSRGRELQSAT